MDTPSFDSVCTALTVWVHRDDHGYSIELRRGWTGTPPTFDGMRVDKLTRDEMVDVLLAELELELPGDRYRQIRLF